MASGRRLERSRDCERESGAAFTNTIAIVMQKPVAPPPAASGRGNEKFSFCPQPETEMDEQSVCMSSSWAVRTGGEFPRSTKSANGNLETQVFTITAEPLCRLVKIQFQPKGTFGGRNTMFRHCIHFTFFFFQQHSR